jgi:GcrA cell cycle regulator
MQWNADKTRLVQELWPTHSAGVIAITISHQFKETCTRNAAMGKVHRLGLCRTTKHAGCLPSINHRTGNNGSSHKGKSRPRMLKLKPAPQWKPAEPAFTPRPGNIQCPCQVTDLEPHNCRWPIGDPQAPDFYFCGAVAVADQPYCPPHQKMAFPQHRERPAY